MRTSAERLAHVEGRVTEHSHTLSLMREAVTSLERRMDRFEQRVDSRFDSLDDKMSKGFAWVIGLFVAATVAILTTLLARS